MRLASRKVVTIRSGYDLSSLIGRHVEHRERLLLESLTAKTTLLTYYTVDGFHSEFVDETCLDSQLPLDPASPLALPAELDGWSVRDYTPYTDHPQETRNYQMTLCLDGLPAVHAKNDGLGGLDLIIGIGARGSKHKLLEAFSLIFSRMKKDGCITEEDSNLIEADSELLMAVFLDPLRRGHYQIHPLEECVALSVRTTAESMRQHGNPSF